jgi:hypothetical protein
MAPKVKAKAKANTKPSYFGAKNLPSVDFVDELAAERAARHADADDNEAPPMKKGKASHKEKASQWVRDCFTPTTVIENGTSVEKVSCRYCAAKPCAGQNISRLNGGINTALRAARSPRWRRG